MTAELTSEKKRNEEDTDHEDDDFAMLDVLKPPPIPKSEPPPLPFTYRQSEVTENGLKQSKSEEEIKKALLDNMKCVENWKQEQQLLMKVI